MPPMPSDRVSLLVKLLGERIPVAKANAVQHDAIEALALIETELAKVSLSEAKKHWQAGEAAQFYAEAFPNGVDRPTLERVANKFREAFDAMQRSAEGAPVRWPTGIPESAKPHLRRISEGLGTSYEQIEVSVGDAEPVVVDQVVLEKKHGTKGYVEDSTVEGFLDVIQVGGKYEFRLVEVGTQHHILCRYDRAMLEKVKDALEKRVIVEGMVRHKADGTPTRVTGVRSIWIVPEPKRSLDELHGSIPDLTGGLSASEHVRRMREDDE